MYSVEQLKRIFLSYLKDNAFTEPPKELFAPVDYILQLGGKRLRPILVLMSYNLYKENIVPALPIAHAIEIFHNFTLVHDDIMDEAPLRRGKPTVHEKYDINTGILSGDVMLIYAYQYLLKIEKPKLIPFVLKEFSLVAEKVCIGQQYDMNFETRNEVSISEYLKMIEYKTAVLLAGALKLGAALSGASDSDLSSLEEFGRNIGLAFQLQDDILDTFGDPEKFGKKVGGDIVQNKKTYLVLKTLEIADTEDKEHLQELLKDSGMQHSEKIHKVVDLFQKYQIKEKANKLKLEYQERAMENLKAVAVSAERKIRLKELANSLLNRTN